MANPQEELARLMAQQQSAPRPRGMQGPVPYKPGPNPGTTEELDALQGTMTPSPDQQLMQRFPRQQPEIEQSPTRQAIDPSPGEGAMSDEEMLNSVQDQMGSYGDLPEIGGMKWEDVDADRAALQADPSEENMKAFIEYWGKEELPGNADDGDADDMGD